MISWTGLATGLCFMVFALTVLYIVAERRKIYQPLTKVFFWIYAGFLLSRGYTMFYEPVTVMAQVRAILGVLALAPLMICTVRVMRLGDPFQLASIVKKLRDDLKEKTELLNYAKRANVKKWEKIEIKHKLASLNSEMRQNNQLLVKLLSQRRSSTIVDGVLKIIQEGLTFALRR